MDDFTNRSDAELLELAVAGEEKAFVLLYERLKVSIFRYAFYMTNSKTAAEEVTQELFIALLKNAKRYQASQGEVSAFAFGIARNLVRRVRRRERAYEALPSQDALEKLSRFGAGEPEILPAQMIRDQTVERVQAAISSLPDRYRQVVVLCDLCELAYAEAASRLRCPVGTVRSRLNRAHSLLARKLKPAKKANPELPATGTEEYLI